MMDKVQFNNQLVSMRKTVKRAKVQLIHHLTRQAGVIRKKKGSGPQVIKNQRRAARLIDEIEIIKDLHADDVTKMAIRSKESLQDVLNKPTSTAEDRAMARLSHHRLISQQVSTFKDLVTDDLLTIGKKKETLLQTGVFERKSRTQKLHHDSSSHKDEEEEDSNGDSDEEEEEEEEKEGVSKNRTTSVISGDDGRQTSKDKSLALLQKQTQDKHKPKSNFFVSGSDGEQQLGSDENENDDSDKNSDDADDEGDGDDNSDDGEEEEEDGDMESLEDMDDDMDDMGENFNAEFRELSAQLRKGHAGREERTSVADKRRGKGLDSMFVGKLSGKQPLNFTSGFNKMKRRNRPGQIERQQMNIKKQLQLLRRPPNKEAKGRHVPLVDIPSLTKREKSNEKMIPGINAPFFKPKTDDESTEKLPSSQRPLIQPASKRGRGGDRGRGGGALRGRGQGRGGAAPRGRGDQQASGGKRGATLQKPETLHPSWEASRRRKEQESKILPFLGKKVTFDD